MPPCQFQNGYKPHIDAQSYLKNDFKVIFLNKLNISHHGQFGQLDFYFFQMININ